MTKFLDLVIPGLNAGIGYAERLLKDVDAKRFARFPSVNGKEIIINHPAFNYGHLSLYPERLASFLSLPVDGLQAPAQFKELFTMNHKCEDDANGTKYPEMKVITETFFGLYEKLPSRLANVPDEVYFQPNLEERTAKRFPILGSFAFYLLTSHIQAHMGQVSSWRRCEGLPPA